MHGAEWNKRPQEPCAVEIGQSQIDDFMARAVCGAFGREAYSGCIMKNLQKCIQTVAERGSVLSTARCHTEFLESLGIQDSLKSGGLDLASLKQDPKPI